MISQEKDKFICEKLGECWHEEVPTDPAEYRLCSCGDHFQSLVWLLVHCNASNPNYSSEAGRVQLLKLMVEKGKWYLFYNDYAHATVTLMLDDTGKFRDAVYRWLGGEG